MNLHELGFELLGHVIDDNNVIHLTIRYEDDGRKYKVYGKMRKLYFEEYDRLVASTHRVLAWVAREFIRRIVWS